MPQRDRAAVSSGAPFPDALLEFVRLFNERQYWESHEVLEQPWRINRSNFYQGLIIYASAFVHAQRGNPVGIRKQVAKVFPKLEHFRPHYLGIDVDAVLRHATECTDLVLNNPDLRGDALTASISYRKLHLDCRLVRGDEPELADDDAGARGEAGTE